MAYLDKINSPEDLKKLNTAEMEALAGEIRSAVLNRDSKIGGHVGPNLGIVETAIALHYVFDSPKDKIVYDVSHQSYPHKILTGRKNGFLKVEEMGKISGYTNPNESEHDFFVVGHTSTSVSLACGLAKARDLRGEKHNVIAVIGDGALTGGMAVEALNHAGIYKDGVKLLIILNDNNCSISPAVGALSGNLGKLVATGPVWKARDLSKRALKGWPGLWEFAKRMEKQTVNFLSPPSSLFSTFDLNYFGPIDGHDVVELVKLLTNLRKLDGPIVLHVKTLKGKGYAPAEADPTTYHGVSPFDPKVGIEKKPADPSHPTYTQVFSKWVCDMGEADPQLYAITPAMREGSGLVEFEKRFPERYRDVAIAEQHAVTYAAGLACAGMHPVVAIYSSFAQRAYDQILHDVAIQNLGVTFAIDRGGIVGADGATHHGVFDLAFLRSIPNLTVMAPSDEAETRQMLTTAVKLGTPAAVRYPRGKGPGVLGNDELTTLGVGKSRTLLTATAPAGRRVAFLAFGSMVYDLKPLAEKLGATLIDMRFVKPLDRDAVIEAAKTHDLLVTAEEGVKAGGAGAGVLEVLADEGLTAPVLVEGIADRFVEHGTKEQLMKDLALDTESIESAILKRFSERETQ